MTMTMPVRCRHCVLNCDKWQWRWQCLFVAGTVYWTVTMTMTMTMTMPVRCRHCVLNCDNDNDNDDDNDCSLQALRVELWSCDDWVNVVDHCPGSTSCIQRYPLPTTSADDAVPWQLRELLRWRWSGQSRCQTRLDVIRVYKTTAACQTGILHCVLRAIILNKVIHAISAWDSFLNKSHVLQINTLFKWAFKYGYAKSVDKLEQVLRDNDDKLFTKTFHTNHAMRYQLPSLSPLVITYQVLDMACRSVLSDLNCIKRHLFTEFYLVSAIDIRCA